MEIKFNLTTEEVAAYKEMFSPDEIISDEVVAAKIKDYIVSVAATHAKTSMDSKWEKLTVEEKTTALDVKAKAD